MNNPEILFYHCVLTNTKNALFGLIKKTLLQNKKALIYIPDDTQAKNTSDFLWKHQDDVFIPHGLITEPHQTIQPVLISNQLANTNQAEYLFFINQFEHPPTHTFERLVILFDNHDQTILSMMRSIWKNLTASDYTVKYYKETSSGWTNIK